MIFNTAYGRSSGSVTSAPIMGTDFTWTGGDNTCMVLDDGGGNWRIKFLSSGIFTPLKNMVIDVFLVGGGGPGNQASIQLGSTSGGGSGYTTTTRSVVLSAGTAYPITIGDGGVVGTASGGNTTAFGATAAGGKAPVVWNNGGDGASGGGAGARSATSTSGSGGSDGSDGNVALDTSTAGRGQGTTTREFEEETGELYAGGGAAGNATGGDGGGGDGATSSNSATPGEDNKGGGGGGSFKASGTATQKAAAPGGSGIVVIRQHKEAAA